MKKNNGWIVFLIILIFLFAVTKGTKTDSSSANSSLVTARPSSNVSAVMPTPAVTDRNWNALLKLPDMTSVDRYNSSSTERSPYVGAFMDAAGSGQYTEFAVDFKADYLPTGTYCCLAQMDFDHSSLLKQYQSVRTEYQSISFYAGFQCNLNGRMNSILAIWDAYAKDKYGNETLIRAQLISPESSDNASFGDEGTGAHCLIDYPWKQGHWYRMLVQCWQSDKTHNTTLEQWVCDLDTGVWTFLCKYDLGAPNICMKGNNGCFLEGFQPETAGNVRSMECKNFLVKDATSGGWFSMVSGNLSEGYDFPGSYNYGADGQCIYFITSGLPNLSSNPGNLRVHINNAEKDKPY